MIIIQNTYLCRSIKLLFMFVLLMSIAPLFAVDSPDSKNSTQQPITFKNIELYFILGDNEQKPFALNKEFSFRLLEANNLELVIYDIEGHKVRTLLTGYLETGNHVIEWDGNNNSGEPVASGVYRYSLRVQDLEQSQIITYLR